MELLHHLGGSRNNLESRALHRQWSLWTSYSLGVLARSATADFPGVRLDEARPGLPTSVDGYTVTFVTTSSAPASTPVEVCCFIVLEDAVFVSASADIAFTYDETEDCVGSFRRLVTRRQASTTSTSPSTSLRTGRGALFHCAHFFWQLPIPADYHYFHYVLRRSNKYEKPHRRLLTTCHGEDKFRRSPPDRSEYSLHLRQQHLSHRITAPAGGVLRLRCNGSYGGKDHYAAISVFSSTLRTILHSTQWR